jgi:hypothetical protein
MKTQYLIVSTILALSVLLPSCVKQPDIPDTTTDIEGTVTDAATGDSMPNYNVVLLIVPYADIHSSNYKTDTTVATDAKGHYKIVRKLGLYKVNKYVINAQSTLKYGPTADVQEVTVGVKNIFNFKIIRDKNYVVINGIVNDLQNNKLNNIKVNLYNILKVYNDLSLEASTKTDSLGHFHFEYEWTDTLQLNYKIIVPQADKYQASDDYWVKWGVDNNFNIVLKDR